VSEPEKRTLRRHTRRRVSLRCIGRSRDVDGSRTGLGARARARARAHAVYLGKEKEACRLVRECVEERQYSNHNNYVERYNRRRGHAVRYRGLCRRPGRRPTPEDDDGRHGSGGLAAARSHQSVFTVVAAPRPSSSSSSSRDFQSTDGAAQLRRVLTV